MFRPQLILIAALTALAVMAAQPFAKVAPIGKAHLHKTVKHRTVVYKTTARKTVVHKTVTGKRAKSNRPKMAPYLEAIRKRMLKGERISFAEMRNLADAGDSLGAFAYAKRLAALGRLDVKSDALHYYAEAVMAGRHYAVRGILDTLATPNASFRQTHLDQAERALQKLAYAGNKTATDALLSFYSSDGPFGHKPTEVTRLLERRIGKGDGNAAFRLALMQLSESPEATTASPDVLRYLNIAARNGSFGVRASAVNMIDILATKPRIPQETKP